MGDSARTAADGAEGATDAAATVAAAAAAAAATFSLPMRSLARLCAPSRRVRSCAGSRHSQCCACVDDRKPHCVGAEVAEAAGALPPPLDEAAAAAEAEAVDMEGDANASAMGKSEPMGLSQFAVQPISTLTQTQRLTKLEGTQINHQPSDCKENRWSRFKRVETIIVW